MTKIDPGDNDQQDRIQVLDDEKKRALDLYSTKLVPPETVLIFDEPTRCYRINKQWAAYVMGMVSWLAEIAPWRDAQDESYFAIEEIQKFLAGVECMAFGLRQKPEDSCILQQTLDGTTWTDVFDFSQCVTIQDKSYEISIQNQATNVQETFIDIYNNYTANYAGLPSDVYPALTPPAVGNDDSALKAALCNAIWEMIRIVCDAAIAYYRDAINQSQQEAQVLLAVAAFALAALALASAVPTAGASLVTLGAAAPLIAAGIGLGAGLANYLVDYWQQHTIEQFQDTAAMEEVACYLVDELAAGDVSLVDVQAALDGHGLTGNAGVIADSLAIMLQNDGLYAAFLEKWNNNKEFADAGISLHCPCATLYKVQVYNFADGGMQGWQIDTVGVSSTHGVWDGDKWKGTLTQFDQKNIEIKHDFDPTWRVHGIKLHLTRDNGLADGSRDKSDSYLRPTPNSNTGRIQIHSVNFQPNGDSAPCDTDIVGALYSDTGNQLYVSAQVSENSGAGQIYIRKIEIQYFADFAPASGYITDDSDICS